MITLRELARRAKAALDLLPQDHGEATRALHALVEHALAPCPHHPDEPVMCAGCARTASATKASRAAAASPASIEARRKNIATARKSRWPKAMPRGKKNSGAPT